MFIKVSLTVVLSFLQVTSGTIHVQDVLDIIIGQHVESKGSRRSVRQMKRKKGLQ